MSHSPEEDRTDSIPTFNTRSDELSRMIAQGRSWSGHERNSAFLNLGDSGYSGKQFANISSVSGFDFEDDARGICVLDWDHDGDLDLWLRNRNAPNLRLLRNEAGRDAGNYLRLQLVGNGSTANRDGIGARVEITLSNSSLPLVRTIRAGDGFLTQSSKVLHFGLGSDPNTEIERLVIRWPDREGKKEEFSAGFVKNRTYRIEQGGALAPVKQRKIPELDPKPVELPREDSAIRVFAQSSFPLPGIGYRDAKGKRITHPIRPDRWTLITLWATWCSTCVEELSDFTARKSELDAARIEVVALSVDLPNEFSPDSPLVAEAAKILERIEFPYGHGFIESEMIAILQGTNNNMTSINRDLPVPCSFLINPQRKITAIYKGKVSIDQVLADAAKVDVPIHDRLQNSISLGGSFVPSETIRKAEIETEAAFQFYAGRELYASSAVAAATHFAESLRIKPDFVQPRIHLGIALNKLNQLEAARQHLSHALAQNPGDEEKGAIFYQLSEIDLKEGKIDEAVIHLESTLEYHPDQPFALNNLAFLLASRNPADSKDFERALEMAEKIVEKSEEKQSNFLDTLGGIYLKAERFDEALATFEKALKVAEEQNKSALIAKLRPKIEDCQKRLSRAP